MYIFTYRTVSAAILLRILYFLSRFKNKNTSSLSDGDFILFYLSFAYECLFEKMILIHGYLIVCMELLFLRTHIYPFLLQFDCLFVGYRFDTFFWPEDILFMKTGFWYNFNFILIKNSFLILSSALSFMVSGFSYLTFLSKHLKKPLPHGI